MARERKYKVERHCFARNLGKSNGDSGIVHTGTPKESLVFFLKGLYSYAQFRNARATELLQNRYGNVAWMELYANALRNNEITSQLLDDLL